MAGIANFGGEPIAVRKWGLVFLWFPHEVDGAELIARVSRANGAVEIRGRVGSNASLFLTTVAATVFVLAALLLAWAHDEIDSPIALPFVPLIAVGYYYMKRRSPFGGPLLDYLQQLLEAKPVGGRTGDPIIRY